MDNETRRKWSKHHFGPQTPATSTGPCEHVDDGGVACPNLGYDLTDGLCSTHYVSDEIEFLEAGLRSANERWARVSEVESWRHEIWRCQCGFTGTYIERDAHFLANNESSACGPPIKNAPTRVMNGKRLTKPSEVKINEEDLG